MTETAFDIPDKGDVPLCTPPDLWLGLEPLRQIRPGMHQAKGLGPSTHSS